MKLIRIITFIAPALLIFSCVNNAKDTAPGEISSLNKVEIEELKSLTDKLTETEQSGFMADSVGRQQLPPQERKKQQPAADQQAKPDWDKKIIKTASVNLEVKDYNNFYASLREKIKAMGGYVAQEEQTESDYKIENSMIIKVPVDQFDNAVLQFTNNAEKINERKIGSQDVTTEVVDTKSRMEAKKQVRQRYIDLLGQAKNMEEILNVQSEINGIQEEIESAAGRIDYLGHSSVFSTINLTYYQVLNSAAKATTDQALSFGTKLKEAFTTGWELISNFFLVIVTIWPLLLGSFFAFLLYKRLRVHKTKQA